MFALGRTRSGLPCCAANPRLRCMPFKEVGWCLRFGCCNALEVQAFDKAQCSALTLGAEGGYNHGLFCGRFTCVFW